MDPRDEARFLKDGYLVLPAAVPPRLLDDVCCEYTSWMDRRAAVFMEAGRITDDVSHLPFERRLAALCEQDPMFYDSYAFDVMSTLLPSVFRLMTSDCLLDRVAALLGPRIQSSPIQHMRPKLPAGRTVKGQDAHVVKWHQDAGVALEDADPFEIITCWIPLVDVSHRHGCLMVIPGSHTQGLRKHITRNGVGTAVPVEHMPESPHVVSLKVNRGDLVLLHRHVLHRSTKNTTEEVRWSMDLRYQRIGTSSGRPQFPDFVVRDDTGAARCATYEEWVDTWKNVDPKARTRRFHRWKPE